MRLEWVRPIGSRRLPTVIVHPEAGHKAVEMRGVLNDLAKAGYLAVAADYQRRVGGRWRESLFPWRDPGDPRRVIQLVRAHPDVDPRRIGLLGFSQGGVFSLLIAAYDGGAASSLLSGDRLRPGCKRRQRAREAAVFPDPCRLPARERRGATLELRTCCEGIAIASVGRSRFPSFWCTGRATVGCRRGIPPPRTGSPS
jgi:dienelactone hydrolase